MRHLLAVCAESIVIDAATNRVSIFNLVDELNIQQFPAVLAKFSILFLLERIENELENQEATLVLSQGENEILRNPLDIDFMGKPRLRFHTMIQGLVIPAPGILRTSIFQGEQELGYWEFLVSQIQTPVPQIVQVPAPAPAPAPAPDSSNQDAQASPLLDVRSP